VRNFFALSFLSCLALVARRPLPAQPPPPAPVPAAPEDTSLRRFELGLNTADVRTFCVGQKDCYLPAFSVGAAAAFNASPHFAFDTSLNLTARAGPGSSDLAGGRALEFLAGVRGGIRARRYGYYLKAQPGLLYWSHVITQTVYSTPTTFSFLFGGRTRFVTDVGGGMEVSLTPRIRLRGEFTDLLMRYSKTSWLNDLQPAAGVCVGLGKSIDWKPPVYNPAAAHPFFDKPNILLLTVSVLGMTADGITTQRGIARGRGEGDPLARPLVKYGWSGQISIEALEIGVEVAGMYGLHRTGHHRIERAVPLGIALTHAILAYENDSTARGPIPSAH
jgi:hypothetical protein